MKKLNWVGLATMAILPFLYGCADVEVAQRPQVVVPPPPVVQATPQTPALSPPAA